jgi:hypothetical protein
MERERAMLAGVDTDSEPYLELRDTRKLDAEQVEQVEAVQKQRRSDGGE